MDAEETKLAPSSPPASPTVAAAAAPPPEDALDQQRPSKKSRKKHDGTKKSKKKHKDGKEKKKSRANKHLAQQMAVQDQMRRALEDDRYSAVGSIVSDSDTDGDEERLERSDIRAAMRKRLWMLERRRTGSNVAAAAAPPEEKQQPEAVVEPPVRRVGGKKKRKKRSKEDDSGVSSGTSDSESVPATKTTGLSDIAEKDVYEEGSIFGPTTGSSHATWVECDKCKKWRRLRGVVDETKLPSRWYCSMNKNDPERARCSAPEEEYSETSKPEEDAADARTRKHLRVWVRRLTCQESFRDARRPMTRGGNKRSVSGSSKEPYEWIRCTSCGKWRACLRSMDKAQILERHSEWYCVMNTWDEKMASCAAPQENLPAIGCPPWVMQDEN